MRCRLDHDVRRSDGGRVLLGGSPLVLLRLTAGGSRLVDRIDAGDDLGGLRPREAALIEQWVDRGIVHPAPAPGTGPHRGDVTVVVPSYGRDVSDLVEACGPVGRIVVVDDGSPVPIPTPPGATVLRLADNRGPGGARDAGLAVVTTPLVAFVDADTLPVPGWLEALLPHFADPRVALVAPRVATEAASHRVLARYETVRTPLDLGHRPARIRAGTRVSYVPAAALVARVDALRSVGGFDHGLRSGEDVDLVWRLDEAGWRCRYEPDGVVLHEPRADLCSWLAQRASYGRSAGPLSRRHPGALAPVTVSPWSAAAWGGLVVWPPLGIALAAGSTIALAGRLRSLEHPHATAVHLAGRGHLAAGRLLASAITRAWWPLALLAATRSRRARRAVAAAALLPPLVDWWRRRPPLDPGRYVALHTLDDVAYGAGVWQGMWQARTAAPLVPDLSSRRDRALRSPSSRG